MAEAQDAFNTPQKEMSHNNATPVDEAAQIRNRNLISGNAVSNQPETMDEQDNSKEHLADSQVATNENNKGVWNWISTAVESSIGLNASSLVKTAKENLSNVKGSAVEGAQAIGRNVVETTKKSVDMMMSTLDPGLSANQNVDNLPVEVIVSARKGYVVQAVHDSFKEVFYYATVSYQPLETVLNMAPQPVGFSAGLKAAKQMIARTKDVNNNRPDIVYVGVSIFIAEVVPGSWFEITCVALEDIAHDICLETFSQASRIPTEYVLQAQEQTPDDYPLRWSGLAVTCGHLIRADRDIDGDWHEEIFGLSLHEIVAIATSVLAGEYRKALENLIASARETAEAIIETQINLKGSDSVIESLIETEGNI
ncbi:Protein PRRC1-B [Trichoplax sp. H2]|nr:Protein PRRC1-B [Trichoplax sp. H2]|eukprot:RDD46344.1 Protein PRRC1-B [Trichoplax sp. H2]